jgi:hypothetical protein
MSRSKVAFAGILLMASVLSMAQSRDTGDSWLMRNYRFAEPPAPGEIQPVAPAVAQLQEALNATLSILRRADFAGDFEAALAAASQAAALAQLIGTITGQLKPLPPPPQHPAGPQAKPDPAAYRIAARCQP